MLEEEKMSKWWYRIAIPINDVVPDGVETCECGRPLTIIGEKPDGTPKYKGRKCQRCYRGGNHFKEYDCRWYNLPKDIYSHKKYPLCKCGRKYVPIKHGDTKCFFCQFTDK